MPSIASLRSAAVDRFLDRVYGKPPAVDSAFARSVAWGAAGCAIAREMLAVQDPCLIARFGSTELACVNFYTRWRLDRRVPVPYPSAVRHAIQVNSGVFPTDDASLDRFSEIYLNAVSLTDVMGVWFNRNEHAIVDRYCPNARLVHLEALNPVLHEDPWSVELEGRTVLAVHPFARTIESQYRTNRAALFGNPKVLPEFELKTLQAVQSIAGTECPHETWFHALASMRDRIAETEFDVAIIGAGAYGLPLAAAVKGMGKQAVQLGGATQLLFGIRGRRWEVESPDDIAPLFNEHWVRPSAEETPEGKDLVEGGCYW